MLLKDHGNQFILGKVSDVTVDITITCGSKIAHWSNFQSVTACSADCGGGVSEEVRHCMNGIIGKIGCLGHRRRTKLCNTAACG